MLGLCLLFLLPSGKYISKKNKSFYLRENYELWLDQKQLMITYSNLSCGSVKYYFPTFVELICFFSDQIDSVEGIYSFASAV